MAGIYARFILDFSKRAALLYALKKKGAKFVWTQEHQSAFNSLKQALMEAQVLQVPDFNKEFVLVTDASDFAVSAVLNRRLGGISPGFVLESPFDAPRAQLFHL